MTFYYLTNFSGGVGKNVEGQLHLKKEGCRIRGRRIVKVRGSRYYSKTAFSRYNMAAAHTNPRQLWQAKSSRHNSSTEWGGGPKVPITSWKAMATDDCGVSKSQFSSVMWPLRDQWSKRRPSIRADTRCYSSEQWGKKKEEEEDMKLAGTVMWGKELEKREWVEDFIKTHLHVWDSQ